MPEPIEISKFGLLDTSMLPADIEPARGRVCHDLIVSEKGRMRSLSKRPGYEVVARNLARSIDEDEIDNFDDPKFYYHSAPHKQTTIHWDDGGTHKMISSIIFMDGDGGQGEKFVQIQFFYSINGGDTWTDPITFDTTFKKTYVTDFPFFDYEIDTDGTNLYVIFWFKLVDAPGTEQVATYEIPLTDLDTAGDQGAAPTFIGLTATAIVSGRSAMGNVCSLQYSDESGEGRIYTAYTDEDTILKVYPVWFQTDGTELQSETLTVGGSDVMFPVVRYTDGVLHVAIHVKVVNLIIRFYTDEDTVSWGNKIVGSNDVDVGFSYQIIPQLETDGEIEHVFLSEQTTPDLTLYINSETADTIVSVAIESGTACANSDKFDLAVIYDNTYKPLWKVLILWDESATTNAILKMRMTDSDNYDGSTIKLDVEFNVTTYTDATTTYYRNLNGSAYITRSGTIYTTVGMHAYLSITRFADDDTPTDTFRFLELLSEIVIEALIQVWREEDGTLQLICQASDNNLYQMVLDDVDPVMLWEDMEDDLANVYAEEGGRFRNHAGIIRMAAGSGNTNYPPWYGYIKRRFFQDTSAGDDDTDYEEAVDARSLQFARLDIPSATTAIIANIEKTEEDDNLGDLLNGIYQFKVFLQYDGFQYSLPSAKNFVSDFSTRRVVLENLDSDEINPNWTGIPCAGHGANVGEKISVFDGRGQADDYTGIQEVVEIVSANEFVIVHPDAPSANNFDNTRDYAWTNKHPVAESRLVSGGNPTSGVGAEITAHGGVAGNPVVVTGTSLHDVVEGDGAVVLTESTTDRLFWDKAFLGEELMDGTETILIKKVLTNASPPVDRSANALDQASLPVPSGHGIVAGDRITVTTAAGNFDGTYDVASVTDTTVVINMHDGYPGDETFVPATDFITVTTEVVSNIAIGIRVKIESSTGFPNPRITGVGLMRRNRNEGELDNYGPWGVVGVAQTDKGENVRWWSGKAEFIIDGASWGFLKLKEGTPSREFTGTSQDILDDYGFVKIFEDTGGEETPVYGRIISFPVTTDNIDNAAAVNKDTSPPTVGIPITGHPFSLTDKVTIEGTLNYEGTFSIVSLSTDEIIIQIEYNAEVFAGGGAETASKDGDQIRIQFAGTDRPSAGTYRYEILGRWYVSSDDGYHLFMDTTTALTQTYESLTGLNPDLDSIEANYRDRCVVNGRSFFSGVNVNPQDADLRETFDDTVIYGPLTGDGQFTQDVIDPGNFLNFGRGDGDNISRIFAHAIGSDEAGESAIEVLAILKHSNIYLVDVSGLPGNWKLLKRFRGVGNLQRDGAIQVGPMIYFTSRDGIKKLQGLEVKDVDSYYRIDGLLKDFTDTEFRRTVLGYLSSRDWLLVTFPDRATNPKTVYYDIKMDEWGEFRYTDLPIIYTEGHGEDALIPGGSTDLDQKIFLCDGSSVFLHPSGTTDDGTTFTAQWVNSAIGKFRGLVQWILQAIGATHYTEPAGADGSVKAVDETDADLSELTLTAVASSSNHPEVEGQQILNGRADSFELEFNVDADATRADLDSVVVEYDTERKLL